MILSKALTMIPLALSLMAGAPQADSDADGLPDALEQELLLRFAPKLLVSAGECDTLPARFYPGQPEPRMQAQDGTLYGQVFPVIPRSGPGAFVEIHYYHLWNRDCGRLSHALDVEHVSALAWAESAEKPARAWKARYWYAAAHEDTTCDASHGIRGEFIQAEEEGPAVWISAGKHASFLSRELCRGGCGGDSCRDMQPAAIAALINLGERNAPMNGASWTASTAWSLSEKMQTDFPAPVLARMDAAPATEFVPINESLAPFKMAIHVGGSAAGAQITTVRKTGAGLSVTSDAVADSMEKTSSGTGNSLKRTLRAIWRALGGAREKAPTP
ncbi:MAG: hypothetical protein QUT30_20170 [Acidobacteriota bacterium]|nr:hypothetical protein [Acidobacteriota bacterium]